MDPHDPELGRLLAGRNAPSVLEKEAALRELLREHARDGQPTWALAAGAIAAAAALLMVVWPTSDDAFIPRGVSEPTLALRCTDGNVDVGVCRPGQRLVFEVAASELNHFAAFAQREDGVVLWYFPAADGESLRLDDMAAQGVLERAVLLGQDHPPGAYTVYGLFTATPLSRGELKEALGDELTSNERITVVVRPLRIGAQP